MEKIDILMATYNGEKYISAQIESVLKQTYSNFNLIILDDSSTDNTYSILEEYAKIDRRIVLSSNNKNLGSNKTFSSLLKKVKSNFFMFCDQDDIWSNTKIEDSLNQLKKENSDLVFTDLEIVDQNMNTLNYSFNKKKKYYKKIKKINDLRLVYLYNVVTGCTILCKSKYINDILKFSNNKKVLHDHITPLVVLIKKGKITYLDKTTIKYRQHANNQVGSSRYIDQFTDFIDIRTHLINVKVNLFSYYLDNNEFFNENYKRLNIEAFNYFSLIKGKSNVNFKQIKTFITLYKNENLLYFLANFCIMNLPGLVKILFRIKSVFKKDVK